MSDMTFQELNIPVAGSAATVRARLYGQGKESKNFVIFSNMNDNRQEDWNPLVEVLLGEYGGEFALLTYDYPEGASPERALAAVVDFLESEGRTQGEERIVLAGASRGGVASLRVAAQRVDDHNIVGVVAISTPLEFEGERLFTDGDLRMILAPKLIVGTEFEDCIEESRNIFAVLEDPRQLTIYPGDAHGTEILLEHGESFAQQMGEFVSWAMRR